MTIYESDLPGVGKKHEVELEGGERLVIVTHNTGKREIYRKEKEGADSEKVFELPDRLARKVGTILEGAYFQPVQSERVETMLTGETFIEWYNLDPASELVGQTIAEAQIRERTGVSIVAIQRGEEVLAAPGPETTFAADDTLVVVGDRDDCRDFESLIGGDGGG
ncbi:cation:proton antiporter regulatory subunit [Natronosalvus halobius]|uniref:cation:proton antiporter regulatory subunit n=1 Tax=Natronosalvus halobius TaxID=2953746 RepID=UPI0020A1AE68|nr:TrkA C-terminal domain-containing protein [Natronosalvus halobius]USZ71965.1 potassium transporter TrkA [Natronosalvus halobius]